MNLNNLLKQQTSSRKLRLFGVACCNEIRHLIINQVCLRALDIAERFADRLSTKEELKAIHKETHVIATNAYSSYVKNIKGSTTYSDYCTKVSIALVCKHQTHLKRAFLITDNLIHASSEAEAYANNSLISLVNAEEKRQQIAEDIFHRSKLIVPTSAAVLAIAKNIYEKKEWSDMPILADALEDAGWNANEVLDHLRSNQPHYRGCWVLDLILDKH